MQHAKQPWKQYAQPKHTELQFADACVCKLQLVDDVKPLQAMKAAHY